MDEITLRRPDDFHLHLRDGAMLRLVAPFSARSFARAIIMPNLVPPVTTVAAATAYRDRILAALPKGGDFAPLMTLYLTETMTPGEIDRAADSGLVKAVKLYPAGATTHSDAGVRDLNKVMPVLERMAARGLPLCVHGEVTGPEIDIFDREAVFIDRVLAPLRRRLPGLKVVMEHITTAEALSYLQTEGETLAATVTVQHLILNRNHMLVGGIRPHYYCLPVLKREAHRAALWAAVKAGLPRLFLGTDSAPHAQETKEAACGCAGCFTAPQALPILATLFEREGVLDRLQPFTSEFGAAFYGLPLNQGKIRLRKGAPQGSPEVICGEGLAVQPFDPGFAVPWHLA